MSDFVVSTVPADAQIRVPFIYMNGILSFNVTCCTDYIAVYKTQCVLTGLLLTFRKMQAVVNNFIEVLYIWVKRC